MRKEEPQLNSSLTAKTWVHSAHVTMSAKLIERAILHLISEVEISLP